MESSGVRLNDLLVSLSLATDLGLGQPPEHMLRATRISMRLGARLGLEARDLATLYDVSVLTYVGCPVYGNEAALLFGDDIAFRAATYDVDLAGFPALMFMLRRAGSGTSPVNRVRQAARIVATGGQHMVEQMANHCSAAGVLAQRLGLGDDVRAGIEQSYARWDGRGVPIDLAGDRLALAARVSQVADACEVIQRTAGVEEAVDVLTARSGTHFDPAVVAAVRTDPTGLFAGLDELSADEAGDHGPLSRPPLTDDELDSALAAIGDFCDLRCATFAGHARGCAELTAGAGALLHLPAAEATLTRRAALIHDVGRFGVPAALWDKAGRLTANETERMRMHVYYVERIFSRPEPLRRIGVLAAAHHERMDGSGYHRGIGGALLSAPARVLAAADAYHAMTQPRPYREAMTGRAAAEQLRREVRAGRLDEAATEAVLTAAGQRATRTRTAPLGLTTRETEVLGLLARGLPNKAIAHRLRISPKTVSNHVEHIYAKLSVSNRAGAALIAMQQGVVSSEPLE
jgi:HD-GYP domain-containing protein (c-di-GMP phosphodiesterase class II)